MSRWAPRTVPTVCLLAFLMLSTALVRSPSASAVVPHRVHAGGIVWGATIGRQFTGQEVPQSMEAVAEFHHNERKAPSLLQFYYPLASCRNSCHGLPFPTHDAETIRHVGAIPMLTWMGEASSSSYADPRFSLQSILDGRWDRAIRRFAVGARRWGHPFFLRFDPEMNGNWLPWSVRVGKNTPAEYARAWRHVYDIFHSVGVPGATWVWCPNVGWSHDLAAAYPGRRYVDWTCLDGYNWGTDPNPTNHVHRWMSFSAIFGPSYRRLLRIAPDKPMMIGEYASSAWGGSKARWLTNALTAIPRRFPALRAISYFDWSLRGQIDWSLESDPAAEAAFARGIADPIYLANTFAHLPQGPIRPAP